MRCTCTDTPTAQVTYYDLLDRVELASAFSWRAAAALLAKAAATRKLPLPQACIRGSAVLTFTRDEPPLLLRHTERLELTAVFAAGRARNRRVTRDLLTFLEGGRRPPCTAPDAWDATLVERLRVRSVPGMGQFDIDGLNDTDRGRFLDDVSAVLGFATIVVLTFGAAAAALLAGACTRCGYRRLLCADASIALFTLSQTSASALRRWARSRETARTAGASACGDGGCCWRARLARTTDEVLMCAGGPQLTQGVAWARCCRTAAQSCPARAA